MAIRHLVTIQVAPGRADEFASAFKVLLLKRWANQELLDTHMAAERTRNRSAIDALVTLWAPGTTTTVERFDV